MLYRNSKGFTLIELMVVLVIVGIMLALMVPSVGGFIANQEINEATQNVAGALRTAKELAISKNVRTQVWIVDDGTGTANGRYYTIYRQPISAGELNSPDTVSVGNPAVTLYAVDKRLISLKGNIGLQTKAGSMPSGGGVNVKMSLQYNFTSTGTADSPQNGDTTIYLMSDKDFAKNKQSAMRAITVSASTGRARIYQWSNGGWQ